MDRNAKALIEEEEEKMQRLRFIVDGTAHYLIHGGCTAEEIESMIFQTRSKVLELFPDKREVFDLIYPSRFRRLHNDWSVRRRKNR